MMNEQFPGDDDLRALAAADPAADAGAPAALRERVAGIPASAPHAAARRTPRWLVPIAAAAAVAVAVGGGYVWGIGGVDLGPAPVPMAVATGTPGDPAPPVALGGGGGGGLAAGVQPQAAPAIGLPWGAPRGPHRFIIPALDETAGQAKVFTFDKSSQFTEENAARMASALGVTGEVHVGDMVSELIVGDYATTYLALHPWGEVSFKSTIPDAVTVCEEKATALHGRDKLNADGTWAFGQEMIRCMDETPMPDDALVRASMSLFLAAVGIDEESVEITLRPDDSGRTVLATAALVVEGNVTDVEAHVTVAAQGIMHASVPSGELVSLGDYAIVSPAEAAARLSDPAFATGEAAQPALGAGPDIAAGQGIAGPPDELRVVPPLPATGSLVPWFVAEHEIVSVRLGLASVYGHAGEHYLAPAYEFTMSDETVWSMLALADEGLDMTTNPRG